MAGERMKKQNKIKGLQYLGLILVVFGIILIAYPNIVGTFAIRIITLAFLGMSILVFLISIFFKTKTTILTNVVVIILAFYTFVHPEYLLTLVGISFIVNGINGIIVYIRSHNYSENRIILVSITLILLGVFSTTNSKAALSTIVLIVGIQFLVCGVSVLIFGRSFLDKKINAFENEIKKSKSRVVVDIKDDGAEEVDFKEI